MKRIISLICCAVLALSFVSCNKQEAITDFGDTTPITMEEIGKLRTLKTQPAYPSALRGISAEELVGMAHTIIYGEVVGRGESTVFDYYNSAQKMVPLTCCVTDVYIKTREVIKGKADDIYVYKETGGVIGDTAYISGDYSMLQPGEKVILFLTENGALIGEENIGFHKESTDAKFTVAISLLKEDMYGAGKTKTARIDKDVFISHLKEVAKNTEDKYKDIAENEMIVADGENMSPVYDINSIAKGCSDVIYGEVIEKGELKYFERKGVFNGKLTVTPYCYREVTVKVISRALGEERETLTYLEVGGTINGKKCYTENMPFLNLGDKALLCLTENGAIAYSEGYGFFKADKNGNIMVSDFVNGGGLEGEIQALDYIEFLKEELEEFRQAEKEKYASGKLESGIVCVLTDPNYDYYDMALNADLVVYGTLSFGRNDVITYDSLTYESINKCSTQVFVEVEDCIYNENGDYGIKEIMYLKDGGETDTVIYHDSFGPLVEDGEKALLYFDKRGDLYLCSAVIRTDEDGLLIVNRKEFPERYSNNYSRKMTVEDYKEAVNACMSAIK